MWWGRGKRRLLVVARDGVTVGSVPLASILESACGRPLLEVGEAVRSFVLCWRCCFMPRQVKFVCDCCCCVALPRKGYFVCVVVVLFWRCFPVWPLATHSFACGSCGAAYALGHTIVRCLPSLRVCQIVLLSWLKHSAAPPPPFPRHIICRFKSTQVSVS